MATLTTPDGIDRCPRARVEPWCGPCELCNYWDACGPPEYGNASCRWLAEEAGDGDT